MAKECLYQDSRSFTEVHGRLLLMSHALELQVCPIATPTLQETEKQFSAGNIYSSNKIMFPLVRNMKQCILNIQLERSVTEIDVTQSFHLSSKNNIQYSSNRTLCTFMPETVKNKLLKINCQGFKKSDLFLTLEHTHIFQ